MKSRQPYRQSFKKVGRRHVIPVTKERARKKNAGMSAGRDKLLRNAICLHAKGVRLPPFVIAAYRI